MGSCHECGSMASKQSISREAREKGIRARDWGKVSRARNLAVLALINLVLVF